MIPQGTALVNTEYFDSITAQINALDDCSILQTLVNQVMATLQAEVTAIESQIAALLPLITLPTDLASVISWITSFATPAIRAYENYLATITAVMASINGLITAIQNAASRLTHCTISIPAIVVSA